MQLWKLNILDLAWRYFRESKAFDLKRGVDTHRRVELASYGLSDEDLSGANLYMAAWTSVIRESTAALFRCRTDGFRGFDFIDVGCGKGKVLLVWKEMFVEHGLNNSLTGIEMNSGLLEICRKNLTCLSAEEVVLRSANVLDVDFTAFAPKLVLYLYNPFEGRVMASFLDKLSDKEVYIIYNNPVHLDVLIHAGFRVLAAGQGRYPVTAYSILFRS